jgi:hypothetical protein
MNPVEGVLGSIVLKDTDAAWVATHDYVIFSSAYKVRLKITDSDES